jgi:uncharacterized membrane protein
MDKVEIVTGQTTAFSPEQEAQMNAEQNTQVEGQTQEQPEVEANEPEAQSTESPEERLQKFSDEFFSSGKLSDDSYKQLETMGYPKAIVDQFIAGQQAVIAREEQAVFDSVGGRNGYEQMVQWAGNNLSQDEIEAYNKAVGSGDQAQMMFAVKGLQARYTAQTREPNFISGAKAAPSTYRSVAEVVAAMSDPRYKSDAAYRSDVERKIAMSNVF